MTVHRGGCSPPSWNPRYDGVTEAPVGAFQRQIRNFRLVMVPTLQLGHALSILRQAGVVLPSGDKGLDGTYLQSVLDALCDLTSTDPLTGLQNRRAFSIVLERELDRVARGGESALLLAVDIDHFKRINDTHGHLVGDIVIREVANAMRRSVRPMDAVARMGGEEFCVVCPNCPAAFADVVAERVREAVESTAVVIDAGVRLHLTVSCGGAFAAPWVKNRVDDWLDRADKQLYAAKHAGRNCVRIEPVLMADVSAEEKGLLFGWNELEATEPDAERGP